MSVGKEKPLTKGQRLKARGVVEGLSIRKIETGELFGYGDGQLADRPGFEVLKDGISVQEAEVASAVKGIQIDEKQMLIDFAYKWLGLDPKRFEGMDTAENVKAEIADAFGKINSAPVLDIPEMPAEERKTPPAPEAPVPPAGPPPEDPFAETTPPTAPSDQERTIAEIRAMTDKNDLQRLASDTYGILVSKKKSAAKMQNEIIAVVEAKED